ncbi:aminoglycoside phosphotransferase family protein [Janibacter sp. G56]|uniref:aminoglycoside phosphotransferase family protein n=1 Tax=Janibacter sp. G56 TaxID=3418717 RepID=UPI003D07196C
MTSPVALPAGVLAFATRGADWAAFVDRLPRLVASLLQDWSLHVDGAPAHGHTALVVPVRTEDDVPAMLKVGWVEEQTEHEHLALRHWHGRGAVQLLRADPRRGALLLERLESTDLTQAWDLEACEIVGGLYRELHVPAPPPLRRLTTFVSRWTDDLAALSAGAPLPRRLVEQAVSLGRDLAADDASDGTLIHADLHYENVLAGTRAPWLAIDPQPLSGDPHYEPAPMLWNRFDELAGDVRGGLRRRFATLVDAGDLDEDRARDWVIVRMMHNALWRLEDDATEPTQLNPPRRLATDEYLTMCVTIAKAVQE